MVQKIAQQAQVKEEPQQPSYYVIEVAKTTENKISDGESIYSVEEALSLILAKLDNMEKKIVG